MPVGNSPFGPKACLAPAVRLEAGSCDRADQKCWRMGTGATAAWKWAVEVSHQHASQHPWMNNPTKSKTPPQCRCGRDESDQCRHQSDLLPGRHADAEHRALFRLHHHLRQRPGI